MTDYNSKYIKYKTKYLQLNNNELVGGSNKNLIIHIAGSSGVGKTTLGLKLKKKYGDKIVVKDLDDLRDDFKKYHEDKNTNVEVFKKNFKKNYQSFLDNYVHKQNKILIITGINTYINDEQFKYRDILFKIKYKLNTHANYKFCIDLPTDVILKQRWYREYDMYVKFTCEDLKESKDRLYEVYKNQDDTFDINKVVPDLEWIFDRKLHEMHIDNWNMFYKKEGYEFLSREDIFKNIVKLIDSSL